MCGVRRKRRTTAGKAVREDFPTRAWHVAHKRCEDEVVTLFRERRAILSAVSTSANKGLKVGRDPEAPDRPPHVWAGSKVFEGAWKTPVLFSRVNCTITAPSLAGMRYRMRDWHWKIIGEGTMAADGVLAIPAKLPVFLVELER